MESKFTSQNVMYPTKPTDMDAILKATYKEHIGLGIKNMQTSNTNSTRYAKILQCGW